MSGYQNISLKYKMELKEMIKLGKDISEIMEVSLKNYTEELERNAVKQCKEFVEKELFKISYKYTPE
jgi:hypothetical protein